MSTAPAAEQTPLVSDRKPSPWALTRSRTMSVVRIGLIHIDGSQMPSDPTRRRMAEMLESHMFNLFLLLLLQLDVLCLTIEIVEGLHLLNDSDPRVGSMMVIVHFVSHAVLWIFLLEILMRVYCFGRKVFNSIWFWLDMFLVSSALVILQLEKLHKAGIISVSVMQLLDAESEGENKAATIASIIVVARFWRVTRLVHGVHAIDKLQEEQWEKERQLQSPE